MAEIETLLSFAQISVTLAGFSAIVALFKRRESGAWENRDGERFNGMLLHSMTATSFCVLPLAIIVFTDNSTIVWTVSSAILGLQVIVHTIGILMLSSVSWRERMVVGPSGAFVVVLQALNVFGLGFDHEFGPYLMGVLWHVVNASLLFLALVTIRKEPKEKPDA